MNLADITEKKPEIRATYLRLISHMASVDGDLDEKELKHLKGLTEAFQIPEKYQEEIFQEGTLSKSEVEEGFVALKKEHMEYSFFLDLINMAMADKVLMEEERRMLAHIQSLIGISSVDFHNLMNFAQTTISVDLNAVIDPMYSYVIENFFGWARQGHVTLFRQTSFAVEPKVDEYLKGQL